MFDPRNSYNILLTKFIDIFIKMSCREAPPKLMIVTGLLESYKIFSLSVFFLKPKSLFFFTILLIVDYLIIRPNYLSIRFHFQGQKFETNKC